jgi:thioredoxin-dependent peroxiredoxin
MLQKILLAIFGVFVFTGLSWGQQNITLRGKPLTLTGELIQVEKAIPTLHLPDLQLNMVSLQSLKGKVAILSIVPSIDTPTCDKQTHILSEENKGLDQIATLITISRDLPFAQKRFAKNAKIHNVLFLSDYRNAEFGQSTGLLIEENRLLTRAIIVLDRKGIIRHLEVVPELTQLPEMNEAFKVAKALSRVEFN